MIAVFAGCRYLDVGRWWWPTLDAIREEHGITEVWHGACSLDHQHPDKLAGVDAGIDLWARDRGLAVRMFPAPWALYRRAGLARSLRLEQLAWCGACLTLGYRACAAEYSWVLFFGSALSAIAAALLFVMMRRAK